MSDPRPRPQYGEYATPEVQAKAMGISLPTTPDSATSASSGAAATAGAPGSSASEGATDSSKQAPDVAARARGAVPGYPAPYASAPAVAGGLHKRRNWDVVLTSMLLGFGAVSVTSTLSQYANFSVTLDKVVAQLGHGTYTANGLANSIGIGVNVAQILIFVITAAVSILVIRRGHIGFYIPLIGAVVFVVVFTALMMVALYGDPALWKSVTGG
jgi:hypothetical protein